MSNQHEENAMGGYEPEQEAMHSLYDEKQPEVTEAELVKIISAAWTSDIDMSFSYCLSQTACAILSRYTLVKKGA
jgi:hypothetical protein